MVNLAICRFDYLKPDSGAQRPNPERSEGDRKKQLNEAMANRLNMAIVTLQFPLHKYELTLPKVRFRPIQMLQILSNCIA